MLRDGLLNIKKFCWFILFLVAMVVSIPLFSIPLCSDNEGFISGHDIPFHFARIEGIKEGLITGDIPAKLYGYVYNNYGNPSGYFYPDLFLYIPAFLRFIGFDVVFSYHAFLFLTTLGTAAVAYVSFNRLFFHLRDCLNPPYHLYVLVAAIIYTGALYRLVDLYTRNAFGEAVAMCFFPLALVNFYLMLKGVKDAWIYVVIGATGVLESHILSSLLLFIAYVIMSLIFFKDFFKRETMKAVLKATVFVALLNVWFYGPFIGMYNSFDFHIKGMISPTYAIKVWSWDELFRYRFLIGYLSFAVLIFYSLYSVYGMLIKKHIEKSDKIFFACVFLCVFLIYLMTPVAPWQEISHIPVVGEKLGVLQFAFRLTMFTTFFLTIALAIAICSVKKLFIAALLLGVSNVLWMMTLPPSQEYHMVTIYKGDGESPWLHSPDAYQTNDYIHADIPKLEYQAYEDEDPRTWPTIKNKAMSTLRPYDIRPYEAVKQFSRQGLHLNFVTNTKEATDIKLPLWYYPHSYGATLDGEELQVFEVHHHRLAVRVPEGEHNVEVYPKLHTPYRNECIISLLGLFVFICVWFYSVRRKADD